MLVCEYVEARDLSQVSSSSALLLPLLPLFFLLLLFFFFFFVKVLLCISVVLTVLKFAVKLRLVLNSQESDASYSANQT